MVLMDFSQVGIASFMMLVSQDSSIEPSADALRHILLNSIRANRLKFKAAGEMVICCDSPSSWRRDLFPYYKARRRANQKESLINWTELKESLATIAAELKEWFPYRVVTVDGCEGDDVIGVLVRTRSQLGNDWFDFEPLLILSGDHDFSQLQVFEGVSRFDPVHKKYLTEPDPQAYLREHIIRGDVGDGIPNILSDDDCLITRQRQGAITKGRLAEYMKQIPACLERNFSRNQNLIDLLNTPVNLATKITEEFASQSGKNRTKLLDYFMKYKLKKLTSFVGDF